MFVQVLVAGTKTLRFNPLLLEAADQKGEKKEEDRFKRRAELGTCFPGIGLKGDFLFILRSLLHPK